MQPLADLIKAFFLPGSASFLLVCATLALAALRGPRRLRRVALPFLVVVIVSYWLGSLPIVADALASRLYAADASPLPKERLAGVDALVVLGAGKRDYTVDHVTLSLPDQQTTLNALEGARLFKLVPGGLPVIASGGGTDEKINGVPVAGQRESQLLRAALLSAGVPDERIILESQSTTTAEQARYTAPILKEHAWKRIVLIAPAVQLPRAIGVFTAEQLEVTAAAAPFRSEAGTRRAWLPSGGALNVTQRAGYDYLGWVFYKLRGLIG